MVGLQTLDLAIGVRVPASQPKISNTGGYNWAAHATQLITTTNNLIHAARLRKESYSLNDNRDDHEAHLG